MRRKKEDPLVVFGLITAAYVLLIIGLLILSCLLQILAAVLQRFIVSPIANALQDITHWILNL